MASSRLVSELHNLWSHADALRSELAKEAENGMPGVFPPSFVGMLDVIQVASFGCFSS